MHTDRVNSGTGLLPRRPHNHLEIKTGHNYTLKRSSIFSRIIDDYNKLASICRQADSSILPVLFYYLKYKILYGKHIFKHRRVIIKGAENIKSETVLTIGLGNAKFVHKYDVTYLNIQGSLYFKGNYTIGRGCRFDIASDAEVIIGHNGYINAKSVFIINHRLVIGNNTVISWNCQFLDDDFHEIKYEGKQPSNNEIIIGNHVWIGCDVKVYKGTSIPDGCVIAAGSIVRGTFAKQNALIAGNPAKVIKENISWD